MLLENEEEKIASLLNASRAACEQQEQVVDGYDAHLKILMAKGKAPLERLRDLIDYLQSSKFTALNYYCYSIKVSDNALGELPIYYIKSRPAINFTAENYEHIAQLAVADNSIENIDNYINDKFYLPESKHARVEIVKKIAEYVKKNHAVFVNNLPANGVELHNHKLQKKLNKPTTPQLRDHQAKTLLQRMTACAAAVVWALQFRGFPVDELTQAQAELIEKRILALVKNKIERLFKIIKANGSLNVKKELSAYITELTKNVWEISGGNADEIGEHILYVERYHTAEFNRNRCLIGENNYLDINGKAVEDYHLELPFNDMTAGQKQQFHSIHAKGAAWAESLKPYVKDWLRQNVPRDIEHGDWSYIESLRLPSQSQELPCIKNGRHIRYVSRNVGDDAFVTYANITCGGTLVPIELKHENDMKDGTVDSAEQLLESFARKAKPHFEGVWGQLAYKPETASQTCTVKPVVFVHSLLSMFSFDYKAMGTENHMIAFQQDAVEKLAAQPPYSTLFNAYTGNDTLNGVRGIRSYTDDWQHTNGLLKEAENLLYALGVSPEDNWNVEWRKLVENALNNGKPEVLDRNSKIRDLALEKKQRIKKIVMLYYNLQQLKMINSINQKHDRNLRLYKAAYESILVEEMAGQQYLNCKSTKDRTAILLEYIKSMQIFFRKNGSYPLYQDTGKPRKKFLAELAAVIRTHFLDESAGLNALGSAGIQDSQKHHRAYLFFRKTRYLSIIAAILGIGGVILTAILFSLNPIAAVLMAAGFAGFAALDFLSLKKKSLPELQKKYLLIGIAAAAITIAAVVGVVLTLKTGGLALAIVGGSFLAFAAIKVAVAGATAIFNKLTSLWRGATDPEVVDHLRTEKKISHDNAKMNKPKIAKIGKVIPLQAAQHSFKADTEMSISKKYKYWKKSCPASIVRCLALKPVWQQLEAVFLAGKTLEAVADNSLIRQCCESLKVQLRKFNYNSAQLSKEIAHVDQLLGISAPNFAIGSLNQGSWTQYGTFFKKVSDAGTKRDNAAHKSSNSKRK